MRERLHDDVARALVETLGREEAEVVRDALAHVALEDALPPRAGLRARVEVVEQAVERGHAVRRVTAQLLDAHEHALLPVEHRGREAGQGLALAQRGGVRGVAREAPEARELGVRDEAEQLHRVGVVRRGQGRGARVLGVAHRARIVLRYHGRRTSVARSSRPHARHAYDDGTARSAARAWPRHPTIGCRPRGAHDRDREPPRLRAPTGPPTVARARTRQRHQ